MKSSTQNLGHFQLCYMLEIPKTERKNERKKDRMYVGMNE